MDVKALVEQLRKAVHDQFDDSPRRQQFDSHLATVDMTVAHLQDEAARGGGQEQ